MSIMYKVEEMNLTIGKTTTITIRILSYIYYV